MQFIEGLINNYYVKELENPNFKRIFLLMSPKTKTQGLFDSKRQEGVRCSKQINEGAER